jgi:hypothetical protein
MREYIYIYIQYGIVIEKKHTCASAGAYFSERNNNSVVYKLSAGVLPPAPRPFCRRLMIETKILLSPSSSSLSS